MELNQCADDPAFDHEMHDTYVERGYCPAVASTKVYCCQQQGHAGEHFAIGLTPEHRIRIMKRWP